jgi:hypothetical protein
MNPRLAFFALLAFRAIAQPQFALTTPAALAAPRFNFVPGNSSPKPNLIAGMIGASRFGGAPATVTHRYFFDEQDHSYFGYDVVMQPEQAADTFRVAFYDLSIGPLDFPGTAPDSLDPSSWKKLAIPALPAPGFMRLGETVSIDVFVDPVSGRALTDRVSVASAGNANRISSMQMGPGSMPMMITQLRATMAQVPMLGMSRSPVTVSGTARDFSVEDAEMHIQLLRVTINGTGQERFGRSRGAIGPLVWFYVPEHGRYILSLAPRPDLGFVKAGEVRGGVITFKVGKDEVALELAGMAASGDAPYILYVLHDPEWAPTAQGQGGAVLTGSVSARELAALNRK